MCSTPFVPLPDEPLELWKFLLAALLYDWRPLDPADHRPDEELCRAILDEYVGVGIITKNENGDYLIPRRKRTTGDPSPSP
jgi:hypothetical protein